MYFYGIILATISPSPTPPPTSDKHPFLLVLPSTALHLVLSWKEKNKKTNHGNSATAFSLQFHFSFLKTFQNTFCRHTRGLMWIRDCRSSMLETAKTSVVKSILPLSCERRSVCSACCCRRGGTEEFRTSFRCIHTDFAWLPKHTNRHKFLPVGYRVVSGKVFNIKLQKSSSENSISDCVDAINILQLAMTTIWP